MLTAHEKQEFIKDLIGSVQDSILSSVMRMPDDWDGHELRQFIANKFANETTGISGKRLKEFRNECLIRNL
jgi:hypothetical protein